MKNKEQRKCKHQSSTKTSGETPQYKSKPTTPSRCINTQGWGMRIPMRTCLLTLLMTPACESPTPTYGYAPTPSMHTNKMEGFKTMASTKTAKTADIRYRIELKNRPQVVVY